MLLIDYTVYMYSMYDISAGPGDSMNASTRWRQMAGHARLYGMVGP
jgi:hypothetical protein